MRVATQVREARLNGARHDSMARSATQWRDSQKIARLANRKLSAGFGLYIHISNASLERMNTSVTLWETSKMGNFYEIKNAIYVYVILWF